MDDSAYLRMYLHPREKPLDYQGFPDCLAQWCKLTPGLAGAHFGAPMVRFLVRPVPGALRRQSPVVSPHPG
jgi:hypothetical protein